MAMDKQEELELFQVFVVNSSFETGFDGKAAFVILVGMDGVIVRMDLN